MNQSMKSIFQTPIARYFIVALLGLFFDFGTLWLSAQIFKINYLVSASFGFLVGLVVNFILSERFVFKDPQIAKPIIRFALYALIGLVGLCLLTILMWLMVGVIGMNYLVAKIIATVVVYFWNFVARRLMYKG